MLSKVLALGGVNIPMKCLGDNLNKPQGYLDCLLDDHTPREYHQGEYSSLDWHGRRRHLTNVRANEEIRVVERPHSNT